MKFKGKAEKYEKFLQDPGLIFQENKIRRFFIQIHHKLY
jgi:hypothetical protein